MIHDIPSFHFSNKAKSAAENHLVFGRFSQKKKHSESKKALITLEKKVALQKFKFYDQKIFSSITLS